eukprot:GHVU01186149.1.p2 GENE.GHVU01186149.1~~GHVU01186149.1.p2  ORF type:complete len:128 (-),score=12.53 GHVU01186149.1:346-729(-)
MNCLPLLGRNRLAQPRINGCDAPPNNIMFAVAAKGSGSSINIIRSLWEVKTKPLACEQRTHACMYTPIKRRLREACGDRHILHGTAGKPSDSAVQHYDRRNCVLPTRDTRHLVRHTQLRLQVCVQLH